MYDKCNEIYKLNYFIYFTKNVNAIFVLLVMSYSVVYVFKIEFRYL